MAKLQQALVAAGASPALAKILEDTFAQKGHTHGPTEVMVDSETDLDSWGDSVEERLASASHGIDDVLDEEEDEEEEDEEEE